MQRQKVLEGIIKPGKLDKQQNKNITGNKCKQANIAGKMEAVKALCKMVKKSQRLEKKKLWKEDA